MKRAATLLSLALAACAEPASPPPSAPEAPPIPDPIALARASGALFLAPSGGGSAVHLGDGLVLTNWHVAISSATVDLLAQETLGVDLPRSEYVEDFAEGTPSASPAPGRASIDDVYCITSSTATAAARILRLDGDRAATGEDGECLPVNTLDRSLLVLAPLPPRPDPPAPPLRPRLVWASVDLDLAIARLPPAEVAAHLGDLPAIAVESERGPEDGQLVWMVAYPQRPFLTLPVRPVVELCSVIVPAIEPVLDPDELQPSDLVVPSFGIDCLSTAPGASGSPVLDARTGALLGLVWTRGPTGVTYVSAAAAWRAHLEADPAAPGVSPLAEVLARTPRR